MAGNAEQHELDELRFHWGSAYLIEHFPESGKWVAQRRDSHATLGADSPDRLLTRIRADYAAHPIGRDCLFRPEG